MREPRRRAIAAVLAACLLCARVGAEDPPAVDVPDSAAAAFAKASPLLDEAARALTARKWTDAVATFEKAIAALGDEPSLGGWRDQALYNTACAQARSGHAADAAATFAKSVEHGLRPVVVRDPAGGWREARGLTLEHVLADADLEPIRKEAAYVAALKPYLAAGEPVLEFTRPETSSLVPAFVLLAAEGDDAERALPAWRIVAKAAEARVALVAVAGPVRAKPGERRWILGDGDERWAVAKVREALDLVARTPAIDAKRVYLVGVGERPGEAAWAAAMSESARLAGFAAPGARFHAAWHADAVAALPKTWRVAVGTADAAATQLLKSAEIEPAVVEPSKEDAKTASAILRALLRD